MIRGRQGRKSKKILFIFIFGVLALIGLFVFKSGIFNIAKINIESNQLTCVSKENILSEFYLWNNDILLFDGEKASKTILAKYPCVGKVSIAKILPNSLSIKLERRTSLAKVITINLDLPEASASSEAALLDWSISDTSPQQAFIIDADGLIWSKDDNLFLPTLYLPDQALEIGKQLDKKIISQVEILISKINKSGLEIFNPATLKLKIVDDNILIIAAPRVVVSLDKDIARQVVSLQLILQKAKIDEGALEIIDLRFDKPVLKYFSKSSDGKR